MSLGFFGEERSFKYAKGVGDLINNWINSRSLGEKHC